jgi:hypothetical protein
LGSLHGAGEGQRGAYGATAREEEAACGRDEGEGGRGGLMGQLGLLGRSGPKGRMATRPKVEEVFFLIKIKILNIPRLWKFAQGDLGGIWTQGFFLNSSRLLKYFRKNEICHAMLCNLRQKLIN